MAAALTAQRPKREVFADLAPGWSLPLDSDEIWAAYRSRMPELVSCAAGDAAALRDLCDAGWMLGIITNGMVDNQQGKIKNAGLAGLVDGWVISDEIGVRKPDAEIFRALARRLDCPLDGWMIGDSLELDVIGGAAVGLRTAWITAAPAPPPASGPASVTATITAPSVSEAVRLILADQ